MNLPELTQVPLDNLKQERAKLLFALNSLEEAIRYLEGNQEKPIDWKNRALDCIKHRGYPQRTIDILNCMFYKEPEKLADENKKRNYMAALSLALNNLCDKEVLGRVAVPGFKGFYYGSKLWFNEKGALNPEINQKLEAAIWGVGFVETEGNFF